MRKKEILDRWFMRSMLRGNSGGSDRMCPSWEESGGWTGTGGG